MKHYLKALQAQNAEKKVSANEMNETLFFIENNVNGIFSKEEFANYFNASSFSEREHLDTVLELMSDGADLDGVLNPSFDEKNGHEIMWLRLNFPKGKIPPKRILFDHRMLNFFKIYQQGKLRCNISLEKLLIVAGVIPVEEQI